MQTIRKYLRSRKSCKEILQLIEKYVNQDTSNNYGTNSLVSLTNDELVKLNTTYWTVAIKEMIERVDSYIYSTWKKYNSHYLTILNWIRRDWTIKKLPQTYVCAYGEVHRKWTNCNC